MTFEEADEYAASLSTPPADVLRRLGEETEATQELAEMSVGPLEGAFLSFLVSATRAQRVLELGTFTGWSSIAMASALSEGGSLVTCDVNPETTAVARRYAEEAGVADRIDYRVGPALDTLATLDGPFDLVFIDADKTGYVDYYEAVLSKLSENGIILADNTLAALRGNEGIAAFNSHVLNDERVESVLVPIRDGVTLIRRRV